MRSAEPVGARLGIGVNPASGLGCKASSVRHYHFLEAARPGAGRRGSRTGRTETMPQIEREV